MKPRKFVQAAILFATIATAPAAWAAPLAMLAAPQPVPEGGATAALLGLAFAGCVALRRKFSRS